MKKALKIILNIVIWSFVVFFVVVSIFVFSANSNSDGYPDLCDKLFIPVTADNSFFSIKRGDLLITDKIDETSVQNLKQGDIIVFSANIFPEEKEKIFIDKIEKITYKENDTAYKFENIESEVSGINRVRVIALYNGKRIVGLGDVLSFLLTTTGFMSIVVIPLMLIFLFELFNYITAILNKRMINNNEDEIKRRAVEEFIKEQNNGVLINSADFSDTENGSEDISDKK